MQIKPMPITYGCKTAGIPVNQQMTNVPQSISVKLGALDFVPSPTTSPAVPNSWPGPNFTNSDFYDSANINPTFLGFSALVDLTQTMTSLNLQDLQSVFIDNTVNCGYIQLVNESTGQIIFCDAFSQGVFPIFTSPGSRNMVWTVVCCDRTNLLGQVSMIEESLATNANIVVGANPRDAFVTLMFTDATMPVGMWTYRSRGCRGYDCSGTIAAGGVFQSPLTTTGTRNVSLNTTGYRRGFLIQNPLTALEPLYLCLASSVGTPAYTTAMSVALAPGTLYSERGDDAYTGDVWLTAATAGHAYTATLFF